ELYRRSGPACCVAGETFDDCAGPFPPPVAQGIADPGACAEARRRDRPRAAHRQQIADIRDDPLLAGLDEPVLVHPLDVALDGGDLRFDHADERAQGRAGLRVAYAVDGREQLPQAAVPEFAHGRVSVRVAPSGASRSNSAGTGPTPSSQCATWAGSTLAGG